MPLGNTLYPHCLVPWKGLKAVGPLVASYKQLAFLAGKIKSKYKFQTSETQSNLKICSVENQKGAIAVQSLW